MLVPSVGLIPLSIMILSPFRRLVPVRAMAHPSRASGSGR